MGTRNRLTCLAAATTFRITPLVALVATMTLTSCADTPTLTEPRPPKAHPTIYSVTVAGPTVLNGFTGAFHVTVTGINDIGDAVGTSLGPTSVRAALWPNGSSAPVDFAGPNTNGSDINVFGQIGVWLNPHATLWTPAGSTYTVTNIDAQLPSTGHSVVLGVNDYGQAVGYYDISQNSVEPILRCFLWTPTSPNGTTGTVTLLPDLGGAVCGATDVNAAGYVVGTRSTPTEETHAFLWSPATPNGTTGVSVDLTPLGTPSTATSINDALQIGGTRTTGGVRSGAIWTPMQGGGFAVTDLGTYTGDESTVADINNAGFVVGWARQQATGSEDAFFWQGGVFTPLPEIHECTTASAMTNLAGTLVRVVGNSRTQCALTTSTALRWEVTVAPAAPSGCLAQLMEAVTAMRTAGVLSPGGANSLLAKVDAAARQLDQSKHVPARNLARAVIAEVNALVSSGRLTSEEAQPLIDAAQCVIDGL